MEIFKRNNQYIRQAQHKKGFLNILLSLLVFIFLVVTAGYLILQNVDKEKTLVNDVSNLKTYINDKYGFEFKYPKDLSVVFSPNSTWNNIKIYDDKYIAPTNANGQDVRTSLREVDLDVQDYSVQKLKNIQDKIDQEIKSQDDDLKIKHNESIINSEIGIKVYEFKTGMVGPYLEALFHNKNYIFTVEAVYPHTELAKQILSTFKFTEPTIQTDTLNWKTYANKELGLSFKYPNNLGIPKQVQLGTGVRVSIGTSTESKLNVSNGIWYNQELGRNSTFQEIVNASQVLKHVTLDGRNAIVMAPSMGSLYSTAYIQGDGENIVTIEYYYYNLDDSGNSLNFDPNGVKIFNQIISTIKFIK